MLTNCIAKKLVERENNKQVLTSSGKRVFVTSLVQHTSLGQAPAVQLDFSTWRHDASRSTTQPDAPPFVQQVGHHGEEGFGFDATVFSQLVQVQAKPQALMSERGESPHDYERRF